MADTTKITIEFDILQKRKECGITRTALCEQLGVSRYLMCQYEEKKSLPQPLYEKLKKMVPQWFLEEGVKKNV